MEKAFFEGGAQIFQSNNKDNTSINEQTITELFEQIGRLKMENEWLKKIKSFELTSRRGLIRDDDTLFSKRKQCELLSINRAGLYYKPATISIEDLQLMRAIDEEYLKHPFYGRRRMTIAMRSQGFLIGPKN